MTAFLLLFITVVDGLTRITRQESKQKSSKLEIMKLNSFVCRCFDLVYRTGYLFHKEIVRNNSVILQALKSLYKNL